MSITFSPEMAPVVGYRVADVTGGCSAAMFATYDEAGRALVALRESGEMLPGCSDPEFVAMSGMHIEPITTDLDEDGEYEVNVSISNARTLLEALGLIDQVEDIFADAAQGSAAMGKHDSMCGEMEADQFLGRVLTALALSPEDSGTPDFEMPHRVSPETGRAVGATMVQCGRRAGYLQDRLAQLHSLAQWCQTHDRKVVWG